MQEDYQPADGSVNHVKHERYVIVAKQNNVLLHFSSGHLF
jgi:hypothetical protein